MKQVFFVKVRSDISSFEQKVKDLAQDFGFDCTVRYIERKTGLWIYDNLIYELAVDCDLRDIGKFKGLLNHLHAKVIS